MPIASNGPGVVSAGRNICITCELVSCTLRDSGKDGGIIRQRRVQRGERLECASGNCLRFWVVVSGAAAVCTGFRDGRRQIVSIETSGHAICCPMASHGTEQWLEVLAPSTICEIDLSARSEELRRDAEFLARLFRLMHARLEESHVRLSALGRLDSRERVTLFLADMAARSGGEGAVVSLPMSREDIADYLGLNTETVSRILTRLRKTGLVRFLNPSEFVLPDMAAIASRVPVEIPTVAERRRKARA